MVRDVPRLVRSEMALATSVGPSKAAIVFDVVIASFSLDFTFSPDLALEYYTWACGVTCWKLLSSIMRSEIAAFAFGHTLAS